LELGLKVLHRNPPLSYAHIANALLSQLLFLKRDCYLVRCPKEIPCSLVIFLNISNVSQTEQAIQLKLLVLQILSNMEAILKNNKKTYLKETLRNLMAPHEHISDSELSVRNTLRVVILVFLRPFQSQLEFSDSFIEFLQKSKRYSYVVVGRKEVFNVGELLVLQVELERFV